MEEKVCCLNCRGEFHKWVSGVVTFVQGPVALLVKLDDDGYAGDSEEAGIPEDRDDLSLLPALITPTVPEQQSLPQPGNVAAITPYSRQFNGWVE